MVKRRPMFMGLSQFVNAKNPATTKVYFATGVSHTRKTYSASKTVSLDKFRRMK